MSDKIPTLIAHRLRRMPLAAIGTCAYILGFAVPFEWDMPLIALALFAFSSIVFSPRDTLDSKPLLLIPVIFFLTSVGASILLSINIRASVYISASLLPASLIYFLIAGQFDRFRQVRILFASFSAISLVISLFLIMQALTNIQMFPRDWISDFTSPILVVPNDAAFLAVIAPLCIALVYSEQDYLIRFMGITSLLLSVVAIFMLQSRTGILTMLVSTTVCLWLIRPRIGLIFGALTVTLGILVDGLFGFPFLAKYGPGISNTRFSLWLAAWAMFLDAPFLGQGPHTYGLLLHSYVSDLDLPNWGPLANLIQPWPRNIMAPWPHNLFLEVLAEQGAIGLLALSVLLVSALRLGWKLRDSTQNHVRVYGMAATSGLLGLCFAGVLELSFIRLWVTIAMFSLVAVLACLSRLGPTGPSGYLR